MTSKRTIKRRLVTRFHMGRELHVNVLREFHLRSRFRPIEFLDNGEGGFEFFRKRRTVAQAREAVHKAKSVRELVQAARALGNAEFDAGIKRNVVGELADTFDAMLDR